MSIDDTGALPGGRFWDGPLSRWLSDAVTVCEGGLLWLAPMGMLGSATWLGKAPEPKSAMSSSSSSLIENSFSTALLTEQPSAKACKQFKHVNPEAHKIIQLCAKAYTECGHLINSHCKNGCQMTHDAVAVSP